MLIPGIGWVAGGLLLAGSFATATADVILYAMEGDTTEAIISGIFLLPMIIGGTIRLVQLSRDLWEALKTGQVVTLLGQQVRLDNGVVVVVKEGTQSSQVAAQSLLNEARQAEPTITDALQRLASSNDGQLVGLDHRFKSEDSLIRKITDTMTKDGTTSEQAVSKINDTLRYTIQLPEEAYTGGVTEVLADLRNQGYTVSVRNYWLLDDPYQGVNVKLVSPDGQRFELQFHTQTSFEVKDGPMHELYEQRRVLPSDSPEAQRLDEEMRQLGATIPIPPGVETIT